LELLLVLQAHNVKPKPVKRTHIQRIDRIENPGDNFDQSTGKVNPPNENSSAIVCFWGLLFRFGTRLMPTLPKRAASRKPTRGETLIARL
jgi:hypothetical protein